MKNKKTIGLIRVKYWSTDVDKYVKIDNKVHRYDTNEHNTQFISHKFIKDQTAV